MPHQPLIQDEQSCLIAGRAWLVRCRFDPAQEGLADTGLDGIALPPALIRAASKRQSEYLAGRWCARNGLRRWQENGIPEMGSDRAPVWPAGFTGSITHSRGIAAAMVAPRQTVQAIGMDYEHWMPAETANTVAEQILTAAERAVYTALPENEGLHYITECFSAKESLFKTLYPLTGQRFYFQDARCLGNGRIRLESTLSPDWPQGRELDYSCRHEANGLLTYFLLLAEEAATVAVSSAQ